MAAHNRSKLLAVLMVFAALAYVAELSMLQTFVAPSGGQRAATGSSSRSTMTTMHVDDPLDFVGQTGKRIDANSENEQLVDMDGVWAIFFTIAGVGATVLFMSALNGLRPS
eukprot:TRINITY_DN5407_c0_g2_i1.p2 TRINITY_DN5407_c0_g2~~TRINITY_DN5407_c0_g2_i1.p2  ORF type:complete len:128 (-),score=30.59 TRINITY_DN5407_c0_g2_i1:98-430(-)